MQDGIYRWNARKPSVPSFDHASQWKSRNSSGYEEAPADSPSKVALWATPLSSRCGYCFGMRFRQEAWLKERQAVNLSSFDHGDGAYMHLPIICPSCLLTVGLEKQLDELTCPECDIAYPIVEGVPVLISDPRAREAIANEHDSGDARTNFYQRETAYLRSDLTVGQDLEQAFNASIATGLALEIGAGAGAQSSLGGAEYCGLDYSLRNLRKFLPNQARLCASAELVPLRSASCKFIFSVATLEHVPNPFRAFGEIDRLLAPGGSTYLSPAWHCREWAADGLPVRPYRDLNWSHKLRKASIPLRDSLIYRGLRHVPWRFWRRVTVKLKRTPSDLRYTKLRANYEVFWMSDSDACSSIDSHEAMLFFESRGYEMLAPTGGIIRRLVSRGGAIVARKRR
jgi:uncharacterized protein YbaR (Trm112 family)